MLDTLHLPLAGRGNVQVFTQPSLNAGWAVWAKPRGVVMVNILCIGGGGGGGGGFTGAALATNGGGGGGGSSGIARLTVPAFLIPDVLFIQVGNGGAGGAASAAGSAGQLSVVSVLPDTVVNNFLLRSGNAAAAAGGAGTSTTGGNGGAASTIQTIANCPMAQLGIFNFIAGQAGTAGGDDAGAVGGAVAIAVTSCLSGGGTGGGGTAGPNFAGGLITAIADSKLSQNRPAVTAAAGESGSGGICSRDPFYAFGGLGGFTLDGGAAGAGGNGIYGSGGGGGGGGNPGGRGGSGGGGLIVVTSW